MSDKPFTLPGSTRYQVFRALNEEVEPSKVGIAPSAVQIVYDVPLLGQQGRQDLPGIQDVSFLVIFEYFLAVFLSCLPRDAKIEKLVYVRHLTVLSPILETYFSGFFR